MWNRNNNHMMGWEGTTGMGVIGVLVVLLLVIITVLVIFTIIKIARENKGGQTTPAHKLSDNEALSILQKRFAQGEISEEEYLRMKDVLKEK
ncbi:SHOCT domain-containing protein [Sporosarcina siberiensis]|uniref:SHOCT domain-containing protein n=1 Tax=Sporosarcina siberiensis TaxID=1365606 RepID=A0ABW4SJA4_9BACL